MSTLYVLLSREDIATLEEGGEVLCSVDGGSAALMIEDAFKAKYLDKKGE